MKSKYSGIRLALLMLLCVSLWSSCIKRTYRQGDYRLYERNFDLSGQQLLRTDGVYVLDSIYSDTASKSVETRQFYVFFKSGQVNLTLDLQQEITSPAQYYQAVLKHLQRSQDLKMKTLFEGYYSIDNTRLVIERAVVPRNILEYSYARLSTDRLEIVKSTIHGKGKMKAQHFHSNYREVYRFVPVPQLRTLTLRPGW